MYSCKAACPLLYGIVTEIMLLIKTHQDVHCGNSNSQRFNFLMIKIEKNPFLDISYSRFESSWRACGLTTKLICEVLWVLSVSSWIDSTLQLCIFIYQLYQDRWLIGLQVQRSGFESVYHFNLIVTEQLNHNFSIRSFTWRVFQIPFTTLYWISTTFKLWLSVCRLHHREEQLTLTISGFEGFTVNKQRSNA